MLEIKNLNKTYDGSGVKAAEDINITVADGEIFGFIGPNGAGKTTTIKMIVGLLRPDSGEVFIYGKNMWHDNLEAKEIISYVPDQPVIYDKLTGMEYLNFIADIYEVSEEEREEKIEKYTNIFNINDDLYKKIYEYSHGMKQKLLLTAALIHNPKLLVLDEPMVGLDPKSAFNLKKIMRERCDEGNIVFFSTHVLEVAENLCDRIAIIAKGKVIKQGKLSEIRAEMETEESLEHIFMELTENE